MQRVVALQELLKKEDLQPELEPDLLEEVQVPLLSATLELALGVEEYFLELSRIHPLGASVLRLLDCLAAVNRYRRTDLEMNQRIDLVQALDLAPDLDSVRDSEYPRNLKMHRRSEQNCQ